MEIHQTYFFDTFLTNELKVKVNIKLVTFNTIKYYEVTYIYGNNEIPTKELEFKCVNQELIHKNSMTQKMIQYLLLDDTELSRLTGTTTPLDYKKSILISLPNFID
tara:strand:+ start:262 stop:579 length:318 start_codon:yes stop_codon:yes gene_type:complete